MTLTLIRNIHFYTGLQKQLCQSESESEYLLRYQVGVWADRDLVAVTMDHTFSMSKRSVHLYSQREGGYLQKAL